MTLVDEVLKGSSELESTTAYSLYMVAAEPPPTNKKQKNILNLVQVAFIFKTKYFFNEGN